MKKIFFVFIFCSVVFIFVPSAEGAYLMGWYDRIDLPGTPAQVAPEGINIIIPYSWSGPDVNTYLNAAQAAGVKILLPNSGDSDTYTRAYMNHPALYGWYLADEPQINGISPATLEAGYAHIKAIDPNHPIAIAFNVMYENPGNFTSAMDIIMNDEYPALYGTSEFGSSFWPTFVAHMQSVADIAKSAGKQFWPILQSMGDEGTSQPVHRLPTYTEERYMVYSMALVGSDAITFWCHYLSQQSWIDSVLTPLVTEFRGYYSDNYSGHEVSGGIKSSRSDVQAKLYRRPDTGTYLLIAAHHGSGVADVDFTFNFGISDGTADVIGENRNIVITGGKLSDSFLTYGVHIYEISYSGTPTSTSSSTPTPTPSPAPTLPGWTFCANENQTCSFNGTKLVQYGANSQYYTQTLTDGTLCANSVFGDPAVGTVKYCYYQNATAKIGDLNNDGKVDVTDLGILLSNWGSTSKPTADINQDGYVNVTDLGILLSNWG